ncbi:ankyrin repeat domain-containing protein [Steroidobacter sp. S1-65]|uniref:Ankyrin repeat domain-containing protein n=1 Tax=Steroidobacter gossypii TaxID=2805490 RepID=A0ABS1WR10_9GAMM|nr:M56 family metallopeptidase [Steroidobacter gossypii]MBM0103402.1 ankyrin repeat domain-containing protein [Steroidobacter gossypii]
MMLAWNAYILILSAVLGVTALALEQLSRRCGLATRWVWASAMVASLLIPAVLLFAPGPAAPHYAAETALVVPGILNDVSFEVQGSDAAVSTARSSVALNAALLAAWALLSVLVIVWFAISGLRLRRASSSWTVQRVAGTDVSISADLGPAVVGFFPAKIVLPRWMLQTEASVQRMAVLHESQHLSARDPQLILAALVCLALMPWNLPLWWMLQRLRTAVEVDCDARVLRSGEDVVTYGGALLAVAATKARTPMLAPALIEPTTQLEKRITLLGASASALSKPLAVTASVALLGIAGGVMAQVEAPQPVRLAAIATWDLTGREGARLLDAVLDGSSRRALELIEAGANVNYRRGGDGTPLIVAAYHGDLPLVELLLAKGADVNLESLGDGNPLIAAAAQGHGSIATKLVDAGANVNALVEDDETPLINAARGGHLELVKYLVSKGADVNFSTIANKNSAPERRSALSEAEKYVHHDIVEYLRANGATPWIK